MTIQTDIYSLIGLAVGALFAGIAIGWFLLRHRNVNQNRSSQDSLEAFFLLFSRLTHRLKTGSEIIKGHLANLNKSRHSDSGQWKVSFDAIKNETDSIDSLVQRVELIVRLGTPGNRLIMEPVNIPRLLEDVMVDLAPASDAKGIILGGVVNRTGDGTDHVISGDTLAIKEIFSIVLENAVRHNARGTEITAEVTRNSTFLHVDIADNGQGFSETTKSRIFDKGNTRYRPRFQNGIGMGLYLCKLLVEQHDGQIDVETDKNGTRVRIRLPLRRNAKTIEQFKDSNPQESKRG